MSITVATIFWLDAAQDQADEHHTLGETFYPLSAVSSGFVIEDKPEYIAIARDWFPGDDRIECAARSRLCIPRGMIQKIVKFVIEEA